MKSSQEFVLKLLISSVKSLPVPRYQPFYPKTMKSARKVACIVMASLLAIMNEIAMKIVVVGILVTSKRYVQFIAQNMQSISDIF